MKLRLHTLSVYILLIVYLLAVSAGVISTSQRKTSSSGLTGNDLTIPSLPPARRSLLSLPNEDNEHEHDTALVAALDGTIYLLDRKSAKALWSFSSGSPIYSSYQASRGAENENASGLGNHYFFDCGEDWKLCLHSELGAVPLDMSFEEFLHFTPHIAEDGGVILGSKETTVFLLDAKTGRLIHKYNSADHPPRSKSNEESNSLHEKSGSMSLKTEDLPLYITRTDYLLQSFCPKSGRVQWNLTVADVAAAFLCRDFENSFTDTSTNAGYELPSEPDVHYRMPMKCRSKALVLRFRSHAMLDSFLHHFMQLEGRQDSMLAMPSTNLVLPSQLKIDEPPSIMHSQISGAQDLKVLRDVGVSNMLLKHFTLLYQILCLVIFMGILVYCASAARLQTELTKQPNNGSEKVLSSKRKKNRKSGRNNNNEKKDKVISSDIDDGGVYIKNDKKAFFNLNHPTDFGMDGRTIGKLFVSNTEIAKGSNGTIILEGIYGCRPVAVKRLVKAHHDVAFREIQNLIASDQHPNIIRWHGVEYDQDFVYLSLERCTCSLGDLIQGYLDSSGRVTLSTSEYKVRSDSIKSIMLDIKLWKSNGHPSPLLLQLMRDMVSGLVHLHDLGIIHRDLKPQNVLIIKERSLRAKLSDMGISKRLARDMSSLGHHATGCGSSGWQAPEQLLKGRQTRAMDLFSLGCVLFFCITGGRHPFGDHLERDINITKNRVDLFFVEHMPEAVDLFSRLLDPRAKFRPKAAEVLIHPLFWSPETRLSFLRDASDRVELEDRETVSDLLKALESVASLSLGGKWDEKMEPAFIANIGRYRRYRFDSIRDLLRVIRNKLNHYRELPKEIQELLGPVPEGFDSYFASRFPKLLIEVYRVMFNCCREEEFFWKYFKRNAL